jgi:excisionase family DNA binding protein
MTSRTAARGRGADIAEPAAERLLSQQEAAKVSGCSKDTIVRARRSGRLPHAHLREGRWMIPADDLAAAGLYRPPDGQAADGDRSGTEDGERPVSIDLARAEARIAALEDLVARQDDELRFLRQLAADTLARKAG